MKGIVSGLQNLWSGILTLVEGMKMAVEFLINQVKNILQLFDIITKTIFNLGQLIGTLPPWLIAIATCTLSVSVIYIILGRETGR